MAMSLLKDVESRQQRKDLPKFNVGDTVRVYSRIKEGEKERVQYFEGIVIGFHRNAVSTTFKVRKESYGVGVERTYPIHSPLLEKIEVKKRGDVRRAKLFYLREVSGKKARIRWLSCPRPPRSHWAPSVPYRARLVWSKAGRFRTRPKR